jgi:hypothetical protein
MERERSSKWRSLPAEGGRDRRLARTGRLERTDQRAVRGLVSGE